MTTGSALPTLPQSVPRGRSISWLHWFASATACQVARPPVRIRLGYFPSHRGLLLPGFQRIGLPPRCWIYNYNSDWTPCMGLFLSRSFSRAAHLSSFVGSLFDMKARFFVSDPKPSRAGAVKAGRLFGDHPQGLALTVPSTAAPSNAVGLGQQDDDQRGARVRARIYRATTLYSVGPRTRTMMQSCASVRSSEAADPFSVTA